MDVYLQIADAIKADVAGIITSALAGTEPRYLYDVGPRSYVRWGIVQKDIDRAIDFHLTADSDPFVTKGMPFTINVGNDKKMTLGKPADRGKDE